MVELNDKRRKQLSTLYFITLASLMWLPLGGVSLNNYVFGLRADHLLHAAVYLPCALALAWLLPRRSRWLWLAAGVLTGLTLEFGQYLLPYRSFDITDLAANTIGVAVGWVLLPLAKKAGLS